MAKAIIHVHQQEVRKHDPIEHPAIIVRTHKGSKHYRRVTLGNAPVVITHEADPDRCGARVWIETDTDNILEVV